MRTTLLTIILLECFTQAFCINRVFTVTSPNGRISVNISAGKELNYTVTDSGDTLLKENTISLNVENIGEIGTNTKVASYKSQRCNETVTSHFYKQNKIDISFNSLTIKFKTGFSLEMRAYDSGVAYRFSSTKFNREYIINEETAEFNFMSDHNAYIPYSTNKKKQDAMAFQATYDMSPLSKANDILAFTPLTVDCGSAKVTIMESDLENYPGMFLQATGRGFKAYHSRYPKTTGFYEWRKQEYVTSTEKFIAKIKGGITMPWRIIAIAHDDKEMPTNNLVYALASENRIGDVSWIKPGKVAWDWWNDWGISGVDFKAGINMPTYKYYIDFASKYKLEYIILDEGWYIPQSGDMMKTIPEINLPELIEYGKKKGVGIVLWTVFNVLDKDLEEACKKYSEMGIKGFKVDFLDRNDQKAVEMVYRISETCAKYKLILDLHGIYAPTGINRTYPNIINFEGVFGMEESKWSKSEEKDMPLYDVTFPFIRMQAGFSDFTPGGFRNATRKDFQPIYYNPLTMGTRCHQMAMYILHDSPFTMLADNPTIYEKEKKCTQFIASIPTIFDEMKVIDGKIGEYIIIARRLGNDWYIAGQTNWDEREVAFKLDFIEDMSDHSVEYAIDGINANKDACDHIIMSESTAKKDWKIWMAQGGGFAIKIKKKQSKK